jgi:hypothetical protein
MPYDVVPYSPEFDGQILALQRFLGSSDAALNAAYLRWKYEENPYFDATLMCIALCERRVVGVRGVFGTLWQVDEDASRQALPYADDLVVDPAHRNRGVVSRIMAAAADDLARRGFSFVINLSAGPITYVASLAQGWRSAGSFEPVQRGGPPSSRQPSRARALAARLPWLKRVARAVRARRAGALFADLDREGTRHGPVSLQRSPRSEAMAALIARLPWDGRIRHVRDARYLAWRFRNPRHEYRFLYAGDETLRGYLVLQRYIADQGDRDRVNIVDWEATDDQVRADLLAAAMAWGRFGRVHAWSAGADDSTRALLRLHGFEADRDRIRARHQGLLVRRLGDAAEARDWRLGSRNLLSIDDWDMRMLYSMAG